MLNLVNVLTYSSVLLYTLCRINMPPRQSLAQGTGTHLVSGASLSRFSRRYLTSEMSRQPALLNSTRWGKPVAEVCAADGGVTSAELEGGRVLVLKLGTVTVYELVGHSEVTV